MKRDPSDLVISATKPDGKVARLLARRGVDVLPLFEDEGNVDRYILSKRLAAERRTGSSFLKGIMEKTLFTSAIYLREHFRVAILVIEGKVNYEYTMFDPRAVRGALSSMILEYGLSVLCTSGVEETVELLLLMTKQEQVGIPEISLIPKRKAADLPDMQRRVIEMLPGCGMVMARDLLQTFGSVKRVVNAAAGELQTVRGLGARKIAEIEKVVDGDYRSVDTERNIEDAIEAEPRLLFKRPVSLLARQHCIFTEAKERHVVDLVFRDDKSGAVVLVELKRGRPSSADLGQLRRYMDNVGKSRLLRPYLDEGAVVRGILASVKRSELEPADDDIQVRVVRREKVIAVLRSLRRF